MTPIVEIESARFLLRSLAPEDATERYLGWFDNPEVQRYIKASSSTSRVRDLETYIRDRIGRDDVLFLGIFDKATGLHIGNIKYEPVDLVAGTAIMGILIGDPAFRGKGVTGEVLDATGRWLKDNRRIHTISLAVAKDNHQAIKAYEKAGFAVTPKAISETAELTMVRRL